MKRKYVDAATRYWEAGDPVRAATAIYDHLGVEHRPLWAGAVLAICRERITPLPEIDAAIALTSEQHRWPQAREIFESIRRRTLEAERSGTADPLLQAVFELAENTAKVTYNASGGPAPYDYAAGSRIGPPLKRVLELVADNEFRERVWVAFTCERFAGPATA